LPAGGVSRNGLTALGVITGLLVLVADQASKWWVLDRIDLPELRQIELLPVLNLTMVWNRGVTFGLLTDFGPWGHIALAGLALAVVAALGVWLRRAERIPVAVALGFGAVVDFIDAHAATPWGDFHWYVFNLADASIVCGVAALVLDSLWGHPVKSRTEDASAG
jgi:lipoprotein signal peptidase